MRSGGVRSGGVRSGGVEDVECVYMRGEGEEWKTLVV